MTPITCPEITCPVCGECDKIIDMKRGETAVDVPIRETSIVDSNYDVDWRRAFICRHRISRDGDGCSTVFDKFGRIYRYSKLIQLKLHNL